MRLNAVLFDLDGTLLDRQATFRRHLELQLHRCADLFEGAEDVSLARLLELDANGYLNRADFHGSIEREYRLPPGSAVILGDDFERHFPESCVPMPNLDSTLRECRALDLKIGLITNGRGVMQRRKIDGLGLAGWFDVIVISEEYGESKPAPGIFHHALSHLGEDPGAAAYVGDNPEPDIYGAKGAGLAAIWRRDTFWPEPSTADAIVDDLSEVPATLTRL